jgi:hypothetical protein
MNKSMKGVGRLLAFVVLAGFVTVATDLGAALPGFARHDDAVDDSMGNLCLNEFC